MSFWWFAAQVGLTALALLGASLAFGVGVGLVMRWLDRRADLHRKETEHGKESA